MTSKKTSKKTKPSKPPKKTKPIAVRTDLAKRHLSEPKQRSVLQLDVVEMTTAVDPAMFDPLVQAIKEATDRLVAVIEASNREMRAASMFTPAMRGTTTGDQVLIKDAAGRVVDSYTMPARETPADDSRAPVRTFGKDEVVFQAQLSTTTDAPSLDPYADAVDAVAGAIGDEVTDQLLADL